MEKKIVVIDDSKTSLMLVESIIKEDFPKATLYSYMNSVAAYKHIRKLKPDLFIIDVYMPKMNGFDILTKLIPVSAPVYFISGKSDLPLLEKAFSMGVSEYFVKPFNIKRFKAKIDEVLNNNKSILN